MELEAARALVPWWVFPAALLAHAGVSATVSCALGALLFALGRRALLRPAPWPLRARALYPYRFAFDIAIFAIPVSSAFLTLRTRSFLGHAPAISAIAATVVTLGLWRWRLTRAIVGSAYTARRALAGVATRTLVMYPQLWTVLPVAVAMPWRAGVATALFLAAAILLLLWIARGGAFGVARALRLAPPAPPEIAQAVEEAAARKGIRLAGVGQIDLPEANAYALPLGRRIVFTRAALQKIDRASLLAIAQLELARLRGPQRGGWICATVMLTLAPVMAVKTGGWGFAPLVAAVVLAVLFARGLYRRPSGFEARFDAEASAAEPEPQAHARALTEIHRLNLVPAVLRGATRPGLYDRLVALGSRPSYPRPRPPSRALASALCGLVALAGVVTGTWRHCAGPLAKDHPWAAVVLDGGHAWTLGDLAFSRHRAHSYDEAATLYGGAAALEPDRPVWPAYQSMSLAAAGRIEEAERALAEAERLGAGADLLADARRRIERRR